MTSILITGGAGFIGSHLTDELAEWLETQTPVDPVDHATAELVSRGLAR